MSNAAFFNILGSWSWTCQLLTLKDMKPNSWAIMICLQYSVMMMGQPKRSAVKCWTAVRNTWLSKHTQTCWFKPSAAHATSRSSTTRRVRKLNHTWIAVHHSRQQWKMFQPMISQHDSQHGAKTRANHWPMTLPHCKQIKGTYIHSPLQRWPRRTIKIDRKSVV